jgi:hypothetical protein
MDFPLERFDWRYCLIFQQIMKQYPELAQEWMQNIKFTDLGRKLVALDNWDQSAEISNECSQ